jgi:hypothetical protein
LPLLKLCGEEKAAGLRDVGLSAGFEAGASRLKR